MDRSSGRKIICGSEHRGLSCLQQQFAICTAVVSPLHLHRSLGHPSLSTMQKPFPSLRSLGSLDHESCQLGSKANISRGHSDDDVSIFNLKEEPYNESDNDLFVACMRRFLYIRCYDSFEFLAALKTMHYQLQKERERHGTGVCLLMIDSIGAFYWIDRASPTSPPGDHSRKCPSLQNVMETSVQEIQKLLLVHPILVLATKAGNLRDKHSANEAQRIPGKWSSKNGSNLGTVGSYQNLLYREFMPSVWQSFVTHRLLVRAPDDNGWCYYCIMKCLYIEHCFASCFTISDRCEMEMFLKCMKCLASIWLKRGGIPKKRGGGGGGVAQSCEIIAYVKPGTLLSSLKESNFPPFTILRMAAVGADSKFLRYLHRKET